MLLSTDVETSPWFKMFFTNSDDQSPCGRRREQTPTNFPEPHIQAMACACTPYQSPNTHTGDKGGGGEGREGAEERGGKVFLKRLVQIQMF